VRQRLNELGTDALPLSQGAFVDRIRLDAARYLKIIEHTGIRAEP